MVIINLRRRIPPVAKICQARRTGIPVGDAVSGSVGDKMIRCGLRRFTRVTTD